MVAAGGVTTGALIATTKSVSRAICASARVVAPPEVSVVTPLPEACIPKTASLRCCAAIRTDPSAVITRAVKACTFRPKLTPKPASAPAREAPTTCAAAEASVAAASLQHQSRTRRQRGPDA